MTPMLVYTESNRLLTTIDFCCVHSLSKITRLSELSLRFELNCTLRIYQIEIGIEPIYLIHAYHCHQLWLGGVPEVLKLSKK